MTGTPLAAARRILLCLRWGIGDLVNSTGLLTALRHAAPHARICGLGARPAVELLETDSRLDEVRAVQDWGIDTWTSPGTERLRADLRAWTHDNFDLVLDALHAPIAVRYSAGDAGVPALNADEGPYAAEAATIGLGIAGAIHRAARAGWGIDVQDDARPALQLSAADRAAAARVLSRWCDGERQVAALVPAASSPVKAWRPERFAAVADALVRRGQGRVLVFAGLGEEEAAHRVRRAMQQRSAAVVVRPLHLRTTAALLARCTVIVSNDTGLMHVGAALDVPCVGLFGPTSPLLYRPPVSRAGAVAAQTPCDHRKMLEPGPPVCATAGCCIAGRDGCMHEIGPAAVEDAIANILSPLRAHDAEARTSAEDF